MKRGRVGLSCAAAVLVACGVSASGCTGDAPNGTLGREGKVRFVAETDLAFSKRLAVGSVLDVELVPEDEALSLSAATLSSSDEAVLVLDAQTVRVVGPGTADLLVSVDGGTVDTIALHAGHAGATALVDGALLAAADVDARLPSTFAVRTDTAHRLQVAAVDRCGGELLDLHASSLDTDGVPVALAPDGPASFTLETQVPGDLTLVLRTPGLEDLSYVLSSIDSSAVDEVDVVVTQANGAQVVLWARAFADDVELIGDLAFSWSSDPRVALGAFEGLSVPATVAFAEEGEPADDRPAHVSAEVFGEQGQVDLMAVSEATTSRGTPARVLGAEDDGGQSCGEVGCDPEAALLFCACARALSRMRRAVLGSRPLPREALRG